MAKVVGVRFKNAGKLYYFSCGNLWPQAGAKVIVETEHALTIGEVVGSILDVDEKELPSPISSILKIADSDDLRHQEENEKKEIEAFSICKKKIEEHRLEMKLIRAQFSFDNAKLLFYFTANGRVDFRMLVKDLAAAFHTRIELRQIGVRDEAKLLGGLGSCGRPLCCAHFLGDFQAVGIRMAKEQNLSLNPAKISGICGRLMCCLKFEENTYETIRRQMPHIGKEVETPDGKGTVVDTNIIHEQVVVRFHKGDSYEQKTFPLEVVKFQLPAAHKEVVQEEEPSPNVSSALTEGEERRFLPKKSFIYKTERPRREAEAFRESRREERQPSKPLAHQNEAPSFVPKVPPKKRNWMQEVEEALQEGNWKDQ